MWTISYFILIEIHASQGASRWDRMNPIAPPLHSLPADTDGDGLCVSGVTWWQLDAQKVSLVERGRRQWTLTGLDCVWVVAEHRRQWEERLIRGMHRQNTHHILPRRFIISYRRASLEITSYSMVEVHEVRRWTVWHSLVIKIPYSSRLNHKNTF